MHQSTRLHSLEHSHLRKSYSQFLLGNDSILPKRFWSFISENVDMRPPLGCVHGTVNHPRDPSMSDSATCRIEVERTHHRQVSQATEAGIEEVSELPHINSKLGDLNRIHGTHTHKGIQICDGSNRINISCSYVPITCICYAGYEDIHNISSSLHNGQQNRLVVRTFSTVTEGPRMIKVLPFSTTWGFQNSPSGCLDSRQPQNDKVMEDHASEATLFQKLVLKSLSHYFAHIPLSRVEMATAH